MSIFTFHRYTREQLAKAHERLRIHCAVFRASQSINVHGDDPHDSKKDASVKELKAKPKAPTHGRKHYRLKNH